MSAEQTVDCVGCGTTLALANADIVGQGYRCHDCSVKASIGELRGSPDVAAHLTNDEREANASKAKSEMFLGIGIVVVLVPLGLLFGWGKMTVAGLIGIPVAAHGYYVWNHNRIR